MVKTPHQKLLIIDFGSQVTQLIARRLRELSVYCEIHAFNKVNETFLKDFAPKAVILSGGPASVLDDNHPKPPAIIFDLDIPILGICYGQQIMMQCLGGKVERGVNTSEFGRAFVSKSGDKCDLLEGWFQKNEEQVWMSHGDHVSEIAPGFNVYATSPNAPYAIIGDEKKRFFAVQFHPEVHHTPHGKLLLKNFVKLSGFTGDWNMSKYRSQAIEKIKKQSRGASHSTWKTLIKEFCKIIWIYR